MAKIIIEIYKSSGLRRDYKVFESSLVRVGRGYHNDLILSDPFVSCEHVVIRTDNDQWVIEDVGSENGLVVNNRKIVARQLPIKSGDEIVIGKTRLRVVSPAHPVSPTSLFSYQSSFLEKFGQITNALGIILIMLAIATFQVHLMSYKKINFWQLISLPVFFLLAIAIWAGIWAFVGRLIKQKAQFVSQLAFSCLIFIILCLITPLTTYLGFLMSSFKANTISYSVVWGILLVLLLIGNLAIATYISRVRRIIVSCVISLVVVSFSTLLYFAAKEEFNPTPYYYQNLKPYLSKIVAGKSMEEFLKESEIVFQHK